MLGRGKRWKDSGGKPAGVGEGVARGVDGVAEGDDDDGVAGVATGADESPSGTGVSVPSTPICDTSVNTDRVLGSPAVTHSLLAILP